MPGNVIKKSIFSPMLVDPWTTTLDANRLRENTERLPSRALNGPAACFPAHRRH